MTDRRAARPPLDRAVEAAVAAGVDWVQIRERGLDGAALLCLAADLAAAAKQGASRRSGEVKILVNRRVDVALALPADGVHLGFDAMPAVGARELLGPGASIGVSTHAATEAMSAARLGLDYVLLAPIFEPLSKPAGRRPLGIRALAQASRGAVPVLAQGGIDASNAADVIAAGSAGVAVTGAILQAEDAAAAAAELRAALDA